MKRAWLRIPEGLSFDMLSDEQQAAINSVFGQYVLPMPGLQASEGFVLCDAVTKDNFDPAAMAQFGIDWEVILLAQWDGEAAYYNEMIIPLNQEVYVGHTLDGVIAETHRPLGWPALQF